MVIKIKLDISKETIEKLERMVQEKHNMTPEQLMEWFISKQSTEIKAEQHLVEMGLSEPDLWLFMRRKWLENIERKRQQPTDASTPGE